MASAGGGGCIDLDEDRNPEKMAAFAKIFLILCLIGKCLGLDEDRNPEKFKEAINARILVYNSM